MDPNPVVLAKHFQSMMIVRTRKGVMRFNRAGANDALG